MVPNVTDREEVKTAVLRVFGDASEVDVRVLNAPSVVAEVFGEDEYYEEASEDQAGVMEDVVEAVIRGLVAGGTLAEVTALGMPAFVLAEHGGFASATIAEVEGGRFDG